MAQAKAKAKIVVKTPVKTKKKVETKTIGRTKVSSTAPVTVVAPVPEKSKTDFKAGDYVVYPARGVGRIDCIEDMTVGGETITLYSIVFEQDRMRLKVPVNRAKGSGLRRLSSKDRIRDAMSTLQGKAKIRRMMWSRRAQEYETKINSGDPMSIAEVVRDLYRGTEQPEQSYSERQIYQAALERLARELAAVERIETNEAAEKIETILSKERVPTAAA